MNIRSGSALMMTVAVVVLITAMLGMASTQLRSMYSITEVDLSKQQAVSAAEAVASLKEAELVEIAASNDLKRLAQNPDDGDGSVWEGEMYFGNCLVRWRGEPVVVANGYKDTDSSRVWTANPYLTSPTTLMTTEQDALAGNFVENTELYHFRIVAEAHYLSDKTLLDPKSVTVKSLVDSDTVPWEGTNAKMKIAAARSSRIIQMRINSLFKYALFYAQDGADGDMEIGPGYAQSIVGKVHSNGGIYISGGGMQTGSTYSNPRGWGAAHIGSAENPVTLTGIDGIFCMRKDTLLNVRVNAGGSHPAFVPISDIVNYESVTYGNGSNDPFPGMSADAGVNGWWLSSGSKAQYHVPVSSAQTDYQEIHTLNGLPIEFDKDSRNGDAMTKHYEGYMKDGYNSQATPVKTLTNIPELGGRPFESQALFADNTQIWTVNYTGPGTNLANLKDIGFWTVIPNEPPAAYYVGPNLDVPSRIYSDPAKYSFSSSMGDGALVSQVAHKLYFITDPWSAKTYVDGDSYDRDDPDLSDFIDIEDPDNPGKFLLNPGADFAEKWMVDAGGLRKYYQRTVGAGTFARDSLFTVDDDAELVNDTGSLIGTMNLI
ncbi:MAG: hypothetical protein HRU15_21035, partial [Planctomycetes bacterium]|nr:hypothetical protein [Planctomycetota bacterium]